MLTGKKRHFKYFIPKKVINGVFKIYRSLTVVCFCVSFSLSQASLLYPCLSFPHAFWVLSYCSSINITKLICSIPMAKLHSRKCQITDKIHFQREHMAKCVTWLYRLCCIYEHVILYYVYHINCSIWYRNMVSFISVKYHFYWNSRNICWKLQSASPHLIVKFFIDHIPS